jgi:hypothetical protein
MLAMRRLMAIDSSAWVSQTKISWRACRLPLIFESCLTAIDPLNEAGKRLYTLSVNSRVPHLLDTLPGYGEHRHQKHQADQVCVPQDKMGTVFPPALVYTAGRGDAGKRTSSLRRGIHPGPKAVCSAYGTPLSRAYDITRGMCVTLAESPRVPRLLCPIGA